MKFRFETLLKVNKEREDLIQKELGRILSHLQNQKERLRFMEDITEDRKKQLNRKMGEEMSVNSMMLYNNFFMGVQLEKTRQEKVIAEVAEKFESKKQELLAAMRKRRTLEILKERDFSAFKKLQNKTEVDMLDETGSNVWRMNL
ncbi:MAG: flagellar export protein FliJ [Nitrospinaceae bacterium]